MAQPILKRRLNPLLLISTVAALSLLAGVAVIAQDQIASAQEEKEKWKQKFNERNQTIQKLALESENKSKTINKLKNNISRLQSNLRRVRGKLENKTEELKNTRDKLDSMEENTIQQPQQPSGSVEDLNNSLAVVCKFGSPSDGSNPGLAVQACETWGHKVES